MGFRSDILFFICFSRKTAILIVKVGPTFRERISSSWLFVLKKCDPSPAPPPSDKQNGNERRGVTRWKRPMNDVPINSLNWCPLSAHPPVVELLETMAPTFFRPISYNDHVASNVDDFDDFSRLFPVFLAAIAPVSGPRTSPPRPALIEFAIFH